MTQDEIIEMPPYLNASYEGDDLYSGNQVRELMKLVAAKEREACAKVVEDSLWFTRFVVAKAIRARGEQA
jgi:hypothetical protein